MNQWKDMVEQRIPQKRTRHKDLMRRGEHFLQTLSIFGVMVEQTNKH